MINEQTLWQRTKTAIRGFIVPRMPRWLAGLGFHHVLQTAMQAGDWGDLTVSELLERWELQLWPRDD
jgi:hypothetical protein